MTFTLKRENHKSRENHISDTMALFPPKRENHKSRENHISDTMALFPPNQVKNIFYFRPKEKTTNQEKMSSCLFAIVVSLP